MRKFLLPLLIIGAVAHSATAQKPFIDHSKPSRFIETGVHAIMGGSTVTQNFTSCFPAISQLSQNMGLSVGVGADAEIFFTNFIALGVEANFFCNNWKMDLAIADDDATSISNCFVRNNFYTFNFPIYASFKFNLGSRVRWNVDAGAYYTYGLGGRNKWTLYSAHVNSLGQLITTITNEKASYYNSRDAFIASSYRGDIGVHLSTGFTFAGKVSVSVRGQFGCKNQAHVYESVVTPRVHNISVSGSVGYIF